MGDNCRAINLLIHEIIKQALEPDRLKYPAINDTNWGKLTNASVYRGTSNHRQEYPNGDPRWYLETYWDHLDEIFYQATEEESAQAYEVFNRAKELEKDAVVQIAIMARKAKWE